MGFFSWLASLFGKKKTSKSTPGSTEPKIEENDDYTEIFGDIPSPILQVPEPNSTKSSPTPPTPETGTDPMVDMTVIVKEIDDAKKWAYESFIMVTSKNLPYSAATIPVRYINVIKDFKAKADKPTPTDEAGAVNYLLSLLDTAKPLWDVAVYHRMNATQRKQVTYKPSMITGEKSAINAVVGQFGNGWAAVDEAVDQIEKLGIDIPGYGIVMPPKTTAKKK